MADPLSTLRVCAVLAVLATGCADANPQLLQTVCQSELSPNGLPSPVAPCVVSGDVTITTGIAPDVIGVRFGPSGTGDLRIRLNAIGAITADRWTLRALVASTRPEGSTLFRSLTWGSCGAACPADPADVEAGVEEAFTWIEVIADSEGTNFAEGSAEIVPDDATLIFRGADIDMVGLSTPGFDEQQFINEDPNSGF